jgi:hypothetical protein
MLTFFRIFGLFALAIGLIIATISFAQPALQQGAFDQRAQVAASHGQPVYVEFSAETPEQKQADRLDGMIYGFGLSLVGGMVFALASRSSPKVAKAP